MSPSLRVAVGLPSYREADSIANVAEQVDAGLVRLFDPASCLIVNVDSDSPDGTAQVFEATPTRCPKASIVLRGEPPGKGRNVLRFFRESLDRGAEAMATVDADLRSITPEWMEGLLGPVVSGRADYVTPLYARSRFESATTVNFAYPLFRVCAGLDLRQPIGGDFGLSGALASHLLGQPVDEPVLSYGIDMFMSVHAAHGGFAMTQAQLGRKIHRVGLAKRDRIFPEVVATGLGLMRRYGMSPTVRPVEVEAPAVDAAGEYTYRHAEQALGVRMQTAARELLPVYETWLGGAAPALRAALEAPEAHLAAEVWTELLAAVTARAMSEAASVPTLPYGTQLLPLHTLRSITFRLTNWHRSPAEVEEDIAAQAALFQRALRARLG